jgi:hypothetical protein
MRFLIVSRPPNPPFYTEWFDPKNHFRPGMLVFDLRERTFTEDGYHWRLIEFDNL